MGNIAISDSLSGHTKLGTVGPVIWCCRTSHEKCTWFMSVQNAGGLIQCNSEVIVHLVLGWVGKKHLWIVFTSQPPRPTQPSALSGTGSEYQRKCCRLCSGLQLRVKAAMA